MTKASPGRLLKRLASTSGGVAEAKQELAGKLQTGAPLTRAGQAFGLKIYHEHETKERLVSELAIVGTARPRQQPLADIPEGDVTDKAVRDGIAERFLAIENLQAVIRYLDALGDVPANHRGTLVRLLEALHRVEMGRRSHVFEPNPYASSIARKGVSPAGLTRRAGVAGAVSALLLAPGATRASVAEFVGARLKLGAPADFDMPPGVEMTGAQAYEWRKELRQKNPGPSVARSGAKVWFEEYEKTAAAFHKREDWAGLNDYAQMLLAAAIERA